MCLTNSDSQLVLMRSRWLSQHQRREGTEMSRLNPEERLFIDGALVAAENGQTYNVINPASEEVAGVVASASLADADRALAAARRCFDRSDWATNTTRRLKALTQLHSGLKAVPEKWRHQIVAENVAVRHQSGPFPSLWAQPKTRLQRRFPSGESRD
jgi:Aldehyde dehydrogenase family